MSTQPHCYGVIPVRYQSTRFPGKPLARILGKPMFWHVYDRASRCPEITRVVLATDDERILSAAEKYKIPAVMTRGDHPSGTDRVLEAAEKLNMTDAQIVVNIQGDEPLLEPAMLSELLQPFQMKQTQVTTLARRIDATEALNPDLVKVVISKTGKALYFSRANIPFQRAGTDFTPMGHIGLYAFRLKALKRFVAVGPGKLEQTEKLEQLRFLENDIEIHVALTQHTSIGVDRPEDIHHVIRIMQDDTQATGVKSSSPE
jgi:3-deoxy-manno-octulosonate cytidylyltransferase (CMP-KDO synthetase)